MFYANRLETRDFCCSTILLRIHIIRRESCLKCAYLPLLKVFSLKSTLLIPIRFHLKYDMVILLRQNYSLHFPFFLFCSIRIQSEYESLTKEGQNVIRRFGSLRNLLILDDNINLVDDYICVSTDTETAQNLTINRVMKHPNVFGQISKPVASGNVWFKSSNGSETLNVDPILQLPEMDSLFNYNVKAAVVKPIKPPTPPGPPPQAPISKSSSPLIIPDSFPVPPPQSNGVEKLSGQPLLSTGLLGNQIGR